MPVTISNYTSGGNTKIIVIKNEVSSTNIIAAVDTVMTGQGWTLFDTVNTTLFNPIVTKVYRVLNADGITFKYLIIRWDTIKLFFYTSCSESWNTTTQQPLNESWSNAGAFAQGYDIANSYIIVSATTRHAMLWNFINNQPGLWTAVIEFERIAPEDTPEAGNPCFAWTNSLILGTQYYQGSSWDDSTTSRTFFAFPRTPDGTTGRSAASQYQPVTNQGMMPPRFFVCGNIQISKRYGITSYGQAVDPVSLTQITDPGAGHLCSYFRLFNYAWDTTRNKVLSSPISTDHCTKIMPFGRAYNIGVTSPIGAIGDTYFANTDITGGWPNNDSITSTTTENLLLPLNGGIPALHFTYDISAPVGFPLYPPSGYSTGLSFTAANVGAPFEANVGTKCFAIGDRLWIAANDGIKTATISAGHLSSAQQVVLDVNGVYDMLFDGQRTIYGATSNGIIKVDTLTYVSNVATSADTLANGCAYLGMDNKNVYAVARTSNTRPTCVTLDRASFTISTANTYVLNSTNPLTFSSGFGTPVPDYQGNVLLFNTAGTTSAQDFYLCNFRANTGIGQAVVHPVKTTAAVAYGGEGLHYDTVTNTAYSVYAIANTPSSSSWGQIYIYPGNLVAAGTAVQSIITSGFTGNATTWFTHLRPTVSGATDYRGDLSIIPYRGHHLLTPKRARSSTAPVPAAFVTFQNPTSIPTQGAWHQSTFYAHNSMFTNPLGASGGLTTNGCQLFGVQINGGLWNSAFIINGLYTVNTTEGVISSRIMLKG